MSGCITLIGGVLLLIITEVLKTTVFTPAQAARRQIQVALSVLDFYCNRLTNYFSKQPSEEEQALIDTITKDLRWAATDLKASYDLVPMKKILARVKILPSQKRIDIAFSSLIYLHNAILFESRRSYIANEVEVNSNRIDRARAALTYKPLPSEEKPEVLGRTK